MGAVKVLLDTDTFLWRMVGSAQLSPSVNALIDEPANEVLVSSASAWEVATKHRLGKLERGEAVVTSFSGAIRELRADELSITVDHALLACGFDTAHRDPFDRMLAAQAVLERAVLLTRDPCFGDFPVETVW